MFLRVVSISGTFFLLSAGSADAQIFGRFSRSNCVPTVCNPQTPVTYQNQISYPSCTVTQNKTQAYQVEYSTAAACAVSPIVAEQAFTTVSSETELKNVNAAITDAKKELAELRKQLFLFSIDLGETLKKVDQKVSVGVDADKDGVGKAIDERLPKKP